MLSTKKLVATTHHELGAGFAQVQEWLVDALKAKLELEGARDDGRTETELASAFRFHFRLAIHAAIASGQAYMQTTAGVPTPEARHRREALRAEAGRKEAEQKAAEDTEDSNDEDPSELLAQVLV